MTRLAHSFRAGPEGLEYLAYGQRDNNDIVYYPDSGKFSFAGVGVIGRLEQLDYWDGEDAPGSPAATWACIDARSADPLRQAEAKAYRRAARRRGGAPSVVVAALAYWPRSAGARIADALATPGRLVLDAAVYAWARSSRCGSPACRSPARLARLPPRGALAPATSELVRRSGQVARDRRRARADRADVLVWALRSWPRGWWLPVTAGSIALELLLSIVAPS